MFSTYYKIYSAKRDDNVFICTIFALPTEDLLICFEKAFRYGRT
jgi:hypothetical protein